MRFWVGLTDWDWFNFLASRTPLDEVNFWQPSARRPVHLDIGAPFLFKLHAAKGAVYPYDLLSHRALPTRRSGQRDESSDIARTLICTPTRSGAAHWFSRSSYRATAGFRRRRTGVALPRLAGATRRRSRMAPVSGVRWKTRCSRRRSNSHCPN